MQTFKKIFFATDFSDCAAHAQQYAFAFGKRFAAELHIGHAVDTAYPSYAGVYGFGVDVDQHIGAVRQQAQADVKTVVGRAVAAGVHAHAHLMEGRPAEAIVDKAHELGCDLLITGTHGRSGLDHFLFGSTAELIVRHAPMPVLAVKPVERDFVKESGEFTLRRVICPVDLSPLADQAAKHAAEICRVFGAELTLVHAIDSRVEYPVAFVDLQPVPHEEFRKRALDRMSAIASTLTDVKVDLAVVEGVPHKAIVRHAISTKADLLVITTHGYGGISRALLGSTAEKLVRTAPTPTLTIRPTK